MIYLWILVGIVGRLVIHIPDVTPLTSLCLLAPTVFSKRLSFLMIGVTLVLSDLCLHFLFHYAVFGSWTIFSYTGWFAMGLLGWLLAKNMTFTRSLFFTSCAAIIFWIWTDFGTWIATNIYPHTAQGLIDCYSAALPFLRNGLLGSLVWTSVLIACLKFHSRLIFSTRQFLYSTARWMI